MIKKIFSLIFLFLIVFHLSSKPVLACTNGNTQCSGSQLQVCINGSWNNGATCDYGCANGVCNSPPCTENGYQCESADDCCTSYCGDGSCANPPPAATATPSCRILTQSCNNGAPCCSGNTCWGGYCVGSCDGSVLGYKYCVNFCKDTEYGGWANIGCWASEGCVRPKTYDDAPSKLADQYVGTRYCPANSQGDVCHPVNCYNAPDAIYCPSFIPANAGCSNGGNCDNCGGPDCGWCGGVAPGGGPTPTPGCDPKCTNATVNPCISQTCYNDSCESVCSGQFCIGTKPNDCACATNLCSTKTCTGTCGDNCTGLLNCAPTTLNTFEIRRATDWFYTDRNTNGQDITDSLNRLHICEPFLSNSASPRSLIYVAWLSNANGWQDIDENSVSIRWLGDNVIHPMTRLGEGMESGYFVRVSYPDSVNVTLAQGFQITMKSKIGGVLTDWTDVVTPALKLKVWNCQVPVSGTLYDGSAGQSCLTGMGFSVPIDDVVGFNSITFSDTPNVTMNDNDLNSYGTNSIVWGKTYLPLINGVDVSNINGNLLAAGRVTRMIDLGIGTTRCPSGSSLEIGFTRVDGLYNVSPYSASPQAQIDFSFIQDQEAWYQVVGAGIRGKNEVESGVPVTVDDSLEALTLSSDLLKVENGLVSAATRLANINGNNEKFGISPRNWYVLRNTNDSDIYNYNYFYNNFYVKAGIGEIFTDWESLQPNNIYFVNGSLTISDGFVLSDLNKQSMMMIVKGDITIQPNVTQLDGIYIADGSILAGEDTNDTQLVINGMLYARGDVKLNRSFLTKRKNNTTPAVKVNYSPGLIFNLDPEVFRVLSGWKEE